MRGFQVNSVSKFKDFADAVSVRQVDYVYRSTPRTHVAEKTYTATEYPPDAEIPLHNENAYQRDWPTKLAFCSIEVATDGGQTPIADLHVVTRAIGEEIVQEFQSRGVQYVRNYSRYVDLPWQEVFQTTDRGVVEQYCRQNDIVYEWRGSDGLRTSQKCQGAIVSPKTGESVFFNQAHLFHVSNLPNSAAESMVKMFGTDGLPRHSRFGDGKEIDIATLAHIRSAFAASAIDFSWQVGDVLLLDNMQVAHGRRSFKGKRKNLVVMFDPYSERRA